jgi:hypothetical protein
MDAGIKDAAEHQNAGLTSARPPADAAHKHHIWQDTISGELQYCDGASWLPLGGGKTTKATSRGAPANTGASTNVNLSSHTHIAQRIVATSSGPVDTIKVEVSKNVGTFVTPNKIDFELYTDNAGKPGTLIGQFRGIDASDIQTFFAVYARGLWHNPVGTPVVQAGQVYHLVSWAVPFPNTGGQFNARGRTAPVYNYMYTDDNVITPSTVWTEVAGVGWGNIELLDAPAAMRVRTDGLSPADRFVAEDQYGDPDSLRVTADGSVYGPLNRKILGSDGSADLTITKVTALPTSPYNGQVVAYQNTSMANNGVMWLLRYNASSPNTHKWECVGGSVFYTRDPSLVNGGSSPTINYAGPSHTIPLAGYYETTQSFNAFPNGSNGIIQSDLFDGSNVLIDNTGEYFVQGYVNASAPGPARFQGHRTALLNYALAAGSILKMGYSGDSANIGVRFRSLGIKPIRVG